MGKNSHVRAEGGQIVVEPSTVDGKRYTWIDYSPLDGEIPEIADAPQWLIEAIQGTANKPANTPDNSCKEIWVAPPVLADLASALEYINPTPYDSWINVGQQLRELGEPGFRLWDAWSQSSEKYEASEQGKKWRTFTHERTSYKAVFTEAQKAGWPNPLSNAAGGAQQVKAGGKQTLADFGELDAIPEQPAPIADGERVPFDLSSPPGLAGKIADYIFKSSRNPVRSFAVAGALQVLAHLNSNQKYVRCSDTPTNLYQCLIGPTGCGKEAPRKAIKRLADSIQAKRLFPLAPAICEGVSSGPALVRVLVNNPSTTILSDEFGLFLQQAMSDRGQPSLKELVKELLSFHGMGRTYYAGKPYADSHYSIPKIDNPYVNVLGTSTPIELIDGVSEKSVDNGFLNRIIMVQMSEENPINREPDTAIPDDLKARLELLGSEAGGIEYAPDVHDYMVECAEGMAENRKKKNDKFANLWGRAEEMMIRVAGLLAIGDGDTITREHVAWAHGYVAWSIKSFADFLGTDLAESAFEKNIKKATAFIKNARHYSADKQFGAICKTGAMPKGKLTKLMKIPSREMSDLMDYFSDSGTFSRATYGGNTVLYIKEN